MDELLYELSMTGETSEELQREIEAVSSMWSAPTVPGGKVCRPDQRSGVHWNFHTGVAADEPYRRLLMAVRRRCWRTKKTMEACRCISSLFPATCAECKSLSPAAGHVHGQPRRFGLREGGLLLLLKAVCHEQQPHRVETPNHLGPGRF